jgi:hypothetical protein
MSLNAAAKRVSMDTGVAASLLKKYYWDLERNNTVGKVLGMLTLL